MNNTLRSVSGKSIKEEHDALSEQIDLIDRSLRMAPQDKAHIISSVKKLLEITQVHFQHEELIMAETNYDEFLAHKRDHQYLRTSLIHFLESVEHKTIPILPDVGINLRSWLNFHINRFDNTYISYIESLAG